MTATLILASKDVQAGRNAGYCPAPHDALGTTIQRNTPGQLWEREAERVPASYVPSDQQRHDYPAVNILPNADAGRWGVRHGLRIGVASGVLRGRSILWGLTSIDDE